MATVALITIRNCVQCPSPQSPHCFIIVVIIMSKATKDEESKMVVAGSSVKRERSDDEEEPARRVSQRTQANNGDEPAKPTMKQLVLKDLRSNDEAVLEKALTSLWKDELDVDSWLDSYELAQKQKEFFNLGGHQVVIRVMNEHPNCESIQRQGIRVINNATYGNKELQSTIAEVDGMHAVIAAMKRFDSEINIQRKGLRALVNLIFQGEQEIHKANAKLLVTELDGIPVILGAMKEFSDNERIVEEGCYVFESLCRLKEARKPILDADGLTALATATDSYKNNEDIRSEAGKAMEALIGYSKSL